MASRTVVLMYHDVVAATECESSGMPGPLAARYKLEPGAFSAHLDAVASTGRSVGLLEPRREWPEVALTFDDGGSSSLAIAALLDERGWRGHFFVTTSFVGRPGFLTAAEVRSLAERGHSIGSHSWTHPRYMGRLTPGELEVEWSTSRDQLADILGEAPRSASIPGGYFSRPVVASAERAGYELLLTSEPSLRRRRTGGIEYAGRYTIWATTPPATAAGYVKRAPVPRARLWLEWNGKKAIKRTSPGIYRLFQGLRARG